MCFSKNGLSIYKYNMKSYYSVKVQVHHWNDNSRPIGLDIAIFKFKGSLPRILYTKLTFLKVFIVCFGMILEYIHINYFGTKT